VDNVASESKQADDQRATTRAPGKRRFVAAPASAGQADGHESARDVQLALRRQAALINLSFEPICAWSAEDGIVEWNTGAEQLYGYTRDEALGQISHELLRTVYPDSQEAMLAVLERNGQWTGELRHTTKDGRGVLVESRHQLIDLGGQRLVLETNRDVTEQRRLERQIQVRAERLEAILSSVADALFVYDAEGHIIEQNPAASAMLADFTPADFSGRTLHERGKRIGGLRDGEGNPLAEEQWPQVRIAHGETLSGPSSVDIRLRDNNDREAYLNVSGAPLRDDNGAIIGSVCLYRDLTERWRLGQIVEQRTHELEAANVRLRTLVEVLPVGVAIVDAVGKPLLVNDAIREIWGYDLLMADSTSEYGAYRGWRVDTGQAIAANEWGLARALESGAVSVGIEYEIESFDGVRKTILESSTPLRDEAGAITGAVSVIFDITARKRQNDRTREALEAFVAITQGLVEPLDTTTRDEREREALQRDESPLARRIAELTRGILDCARVSISVIEEDPPVARPVMIVGLSPEEERNWWAEQPEPQPLGVGLLPEDRERLFAGHALTLDITRPPYEIPNNYGATAILVAPMITQGRMVGLLALDFLEPHNGVHAFTSEEVQVAEAVARLGALVLEHDRLLGEREAARAQVLALAEANRRMAECLGIAGHELRTPLTTVKANLQLAERRAQRIFQVESQRESQASAGKTGTGKERDPAGQLLRLLEQATVSVERQERLVQDLLDISRISSGRLEYRMERYDLATLAREAIEEQLISAPMRRIELDAPDDPLYVMADADRVGQVLANYLTNALKYSAADKPVVVTVRREDASARVEVRDQGPGLSTKQRRRLFERFYRVPGVDVVSGSGVGLGLGLYISKTIIEQHSGSVGVESAVGEGSMFWCSLPLADQND
jgi:PAS domain S-box-containing protein